MTQVLLLLQDVLHHYSFFNLHLLCSSLVTLLYFCLDVNYHRSMKISHLFNEIIIQNLDALSVMRISTGRTLPTIYVTATPRTHAQVYRNVT